MRSTGWYDRPNVKILEGRWQDFVTQSYIYGEGGWDVVYIDTFTEGYEGNAWHSYPAIILNALLAELKRFFDILPDLLSGPESRFSFFNGLGATSSFDHCFVTRSLTVPASTDSVFYDVYTQLAELNLKDSGINVEWIDVENEDGSDQDRWGDTKSYFKNRIYRLPVGHMMEI